ncbi:hypothetical protein JET72_09385 [Pseudomonas juntendi]|uniref:hypothetical protein n=1 Tax=Pseudomonas juntendi TaxID=2666183 RepID=UPI0018E6BC90|nr:hypothetical protein [Pseudomonas juntendi]MBI6914113.1 hypothetical protein [Pseudomonas juntendi]
MSDVSVDNVWHEDIVQLRRANATMRLANQALASRDRVRLYALGFSHAHIRELEIKGGFRSSSIGQNTRLINLLQKKGLANAD